VAPGFVVWEPRILGGAHGSGGMESVSRRRVLARLATAGGLGALAGCATGDGDGDGTTDEAGTAGSETGSATAGGGTTGSGSAGGLDLREANVTDVAVEAVGDGEYRFDVTLYHDDDGEEGYADLWVVERRDGTELGRRPLAHAHGTQPFTRSTTVAVPGDVECVVVRGRDQTHGFGGQATLVTLETGATRAVRQGSERASLADEGCP
jgi:hypothetical protein